MNPTEFNTQVMQWSPRLIKLTLIANPDWHGAVPTPGYVDPRLIVSVCCAKSGFLKRGLPAGAPPEAHPEVDCTRVVLYGGSELPVLESTEEVARLRDEALGHERKSAELREVKT